MLLHTSDDQAVRSTNQGWAGKSQQPRAGYLADPEMVRPAELKERRKSVRRRANRLQGRSLEILGHAVEYLVDSRMFSVEPSAAKAEREAVQILMRLSRAVFEECDEVFTLWDRMAGLYDRSNKDQPKTAGAANG